MGLNRAVRGKPIFSGLNGVMAHHDVPIVSAQRHFHTLCQLHNKPVTKNIIENQRSESGMRIASSVRNPKGEAHESKRHSGFAG
jgi:hypothetical protein